MQRKSSRSQAGWTAALFAAAFLSGCAGPSTKVLPQRQGGTLQDVPEEVPVVEEVNSFYLQESLGILSSKPRQAGSRGEDDAARYIQRMLKDYGYTVSRQRFREKNEHETVIGTNVVAVRQVEDPDADILVIASWHDSVPDSPGAANNASGTSVFLETARILSGIPSDTEVRFVSLSAHHKDALGASMYTKSLSKREKERLIGVITLGPCGALDGGETVLETQDGALTMLGDLIRESAGTVATDSWEYVRHAGMENGIFASYGIPAVQIGQEYASFAEQTPLDTPEVVDVECLSQIVDTLCQAVSKVMSLETPSMRAKAHFENNWRAFVYRQPEHGLIPFGSSSSALGAYLGIPGKLAVVNRDAKNRPIEKYQFRMNWFGLERQLTASYYFTDDVLDLVSLKPTNAEVSNEQIRDRLLELYGTPVKQISGPYGKDCIWQDELSGQQLELTFQRESFELEIRPLTQKQQVIGRFTPDGTLLEGAQVERAGMEQLQALCAVLFANREGLPSADLVYATDGIGGTVLTVSQREQPKTGHKETSQEEAGWEIFLDPADLLALDGSFFDRTKAIKELVMAYGQVVKASWSEETLQGYERLLTQETEAEILDAKPGEMLPETTKCPTFEEAFALFVLTEKPREEPGIYQACIRYFYQFEELNTYRSAVRAYLGLQTEE